MAWEATNLPPDVKSSLAKGKLTFIPGPDEHPIPVRVYGLQKKGTPVIMIHGLQSHSGWFAQSSAFLAAHGHPVYALDRRGSGLSRAPRGDCKNFLDWSREIRLVAEDALKRHGTDQVYIFGHCFGAIPATVFADENPGLVKGLILTTPGLYTHVSLSFPETMKVLFTPSGQGDYLLPVPLDADWFSELPEYKAFILQDPLALTAASGDFYWQVHRARKHIRKETEKLTMPVLIGLAAQDPISDSAKNGEWIAEVPSLSKTIIVYQQARHILEYSLERKNYFRDLAYWLYWMERS
jgi:alpha-beta hydrolase superfamily lysophospholipase